MDPLLLYNVLASLRNNPNLAIPAKLLGPVCGFAKLRRDGYIRILKDNNGYKAQLTEKGHTIINEYVFKESISNFIK